MMNQNSERSAGPASGLRGLKQIARYPSVSGDQSWPQMNENTMTAFIDNDSHQSVHIPVGVQPSSHMGLTNQWNPITPKLRPQNYATTSSKLQLLAALTSNTARCSNNISAEATNNVGKSSSQ